MDRVLHRKARGDREGEERYHFSLPEENKKLPEKIEGTAHFFFVRKC